LKQREIWGTPSGLTLAPLTLHGFGSIGTLAFGALVDVEPWRSLESFAAGRVFCWHVYPDIGDAKGRGSQLELGVSILMCARGD